MVNCGNREMEREREREGEGEGEGKPLSIILICCYDNFSGVVIMESMTSFQHSIQIKFMKFGEKLFSKYLITTSNKTISFPLHFILFSDLVFLFFIFLFFYFYFILFYVFMLLFFFNYFF
jgi:hypothetical protein